jgi:hypothetical protein
MTPAEESAVEYTRVDAPSHRPRRTAVIVAVSSVALAAAVLSISISLPSIPLFDLKKAAPIPHTGEYCTGSGAKAYSKGTLKRIVDRTVAGLLEFSAHEPKFEASDVIRVEDKFYVVCDSSWDILSIDERMPLLSPKNEVIKPDASFSPPDEDSGFEVIIHDGSAPGDFYVVRESIKHVDKYDAHILKVKLNASAGTYSVEETCESELTFEGDSKGFEGGVSLRGKDGVLYLLGLCEGNYCSESRGKETGNGRVVVMARQEVDPSVAAGGCMWKTVRMLELPKAVQFVDYSAIALHHATQSAAVTSQENSQLWIGSLETGSNGDFEPDKAEFSEGKVYDFPRSDGGCEAIYCNVEGIHWVTEGTKGSAAPGTLVAVSDKMKSKGRQPAVCHDKDQSVHLFSLP